jgi:Ran GTPase-activating protein (RanGAP) involved in mRNA processing and transport
VLLSPSHVTVLSHTGFAVQGEKERSKNRWKIKIFSKKDPADEIYRNFKRMLLEVQARNLIVDKLLYETDRDARREFRVAHPAMLSCPNCSDCFLHPNDYHIHVADIALHESRQKQTDELLLKFAPVENAFLGAFGRKLMAHRLLYSSDLAGLHARLNAVSRQPYRPFIGDPEGHRAEQLRHKSLVLGCDPRAGIRPLVESISLAKQHRSTWGLEHGQSSLQDVITQLTHVRDVPMDIVITDQLAAHTSVTLDWRGYIRFDVFILGEFNNWKPQMMLPDEHGRYSVTLQLSPGRYQYRFIADGVEKHEPTSSNIQIGDKINNIVLVTNPLINDRAITLPKAICLRNSNLVDGGAWALSRCVQDNTHIELLDVSCNSISDEGVQAIAEACLHLKALRVLKLSSNGFTYDGCRYLANSYKQSESLETLELSNNRAGDDGAAALANILHGHKSLVDLILDANYIGNDGAAELGLKLQSNNSLQVLSLSGNRIRSPGTERLSFYLRTNAMLKTLKLSGNPLGPEGVRYVGELLLYSDTIQYLDLSYTQMLLGKHQQGIMAICDGLRRNKGLKTLLLKGNDISNEGALEIAYGLSGNRALTELDLGDNPIVSQWFQPNLYLKTRLLAKMPTIETSLQRNRAIERDPELHERFSVPEKIIDPNPDGTWTKRRNWKVQKKKAAIVEKEEMMKVDVSEEEIRIQNEEEFIRDALFKEAVTLSSFLSSREGGGTVRCVAKLINQYIKFLSQPSNKIEGWFEPCHEAIISGFLIEAQHEVDTQEALEATAAAELAAKALDDKMKQEKANEHLLPAVEGKKKSKKRDKPNKDSHLAPPIVAPASPTKQNHTLQPSNNHSQAPAHLPSEGQHVDSPQVHESLVQTVSAKCVPIFFKKMAINLKDEDMKTVIEACATQREEDAHANNKDGDSLAHHALMINRRKFVKYFVTSYRSLVTPGINRSIGRLLLQRPIAVATRILFENGINAKRIDLRLKYRGQKGKEPKYICHVCGKRFISERAEKKHIHEKATKEHAKLRYMDELWLSQSRLILEGKLMQSGTRLPAYYELGETLLLPKYYSPQIFDKYGDEGRPIGVIEPDLAYRVDDLLGNWIQVNEK